MTATDLAALLNTHPFTMDLPAAVRVELETVADLVELRAGETLFTQGDPGDSAYLVTSGRLVADVDGRPVGDISRGEAVGEMALLTGEPRSATIVARRPTVLVRLGADRFAGLLATQPDALRLVTTQLVRRLGATLRGAGATAPATVVGVSAGDPGLAATLAGRIADATGREGLTAVVTADPTSQSVERLELGHDVVVVAMTPTELVEHGDRCDRTLYVVAPDQERPGDPRTVGHVTDLVLVHPSTTPLPSGTPRWLAAIDSNDHHHVRHGSTSDAARLTRRILGRERVLVFGGGGARGLAHLGTYRALTEAGIEVDALVGVSAGALFATAVALDWSPARAIERSTTMLVDAGSLVDLTVPMVALSSGRRITEAIKEAFGGTVELEDLWRPMTCVSADLTTLSTHVQTTGPVWRAVRATVAVPGVFPPLVEGDAVLVDGGVVDNLPIDRARRLYPGAMIIGSDVGRRNEVLTFDLPTDGVVPGWRSMWHRITRRHRTPSLVRLLYRLTALGGGSNGQTTGDLHIEHDLDGIGMFDFARARPAIDAGYVRTHEVLAAAATDGPPAVQRILQTAGAVHATIAAGE